MRTSKHNRSLYRATGKIYEKYHWRRWRLGKALTMLPVLLCLATLWSTNSGCRKSSDANIDAGPPPRPCVPIAGSALCWPLPEHWQVEPAPAPAIAEPESASASPETASAASGNAIDLTNSKLLVSGRRIASNQARLIAPRVDVYQNVELPENTSATDYLAANRVAQKKTLGEIGIRHLEVEPVRRQGRRGFHLRDAFDVPIPQGGKAPVSQQALLLLDGRTGYVIVVTLHEDDRPHLSEEIRTWLSGIAFVDAH